MTRLAGLMLAARLFARLPGTDGPVPDISAQVACSRLHDCGRHSLGLAACCGVPGMARDLDFPRGVQATAAVRSSILDGGVQYRSRIVRLAFVSVSQRMASWSLLAIACARVGVRRFTDLHGVHFEGHARRGPVPTATGVVLFVGHHVDSDSALSWLNYATMLFVPFALLAAAGVRNRVSERAIWAAMVSYFLSLFAFGGLLLLDPRLPIVCSWCW